MALTTVSAIIPSRGRPDGLVRAIDSLRATQGAHDLEIVVVLDAPDAASQQAMTARTDVQVVVVGGEYLGRPQDKYNVGLAAARGDWIVAFADDCTMDNAGWIEALLASGERGGFAGLYDKVHPPNSYATLVAASRDYIQSVMGGYLGLPWYHVWWADYEWAARAKRIGAFVVCEHASFTHHHAIFGRAQTDEIYELAAKWRKEDERTYGERERLGFPNA